MSETVKSPFTMVGSEDAAVCIDGVCEVPSAHEPATNDAPPAAPPKATPTAAK